MIVLSSIFASLFTVFLFVKKVSSHDDSGYDSGYVFVDVKNVRNEAVRTICVNYQQWQSQQIAENSEAATRLKLTFWGGGKDADICKYPEDRNLSMHVVPSYYHLLSPSRKFCSDFPPIVHWKKQFPYLVNRIKSKDASVALFLVRRGNQYYKQFPDVLFADFFDPFLSKSGNYSVDFPVYFTYNDTFHDKMLSMSEKGDGSDLELKFYRPHTFEIDGAMVIILLLSLFCVAVGGWWSGKYRSVLWLEEIEREKGDVKTVEQSQFEAPTGERTENLLNEATQTTSGQDEDREPSAAPFTWVTVVTFVVVIVGMLLLLYFFYSIFVWFIIVMFTVASCLAAHNCLSALLDPIPCARCRICWSLADCYKGLIGTELRGGCSCCRAKPMIRNIVLFLCCAAFAISWCVFRKWPFSFILQDILSVFFCIHLIKTLRVPNLKWLTILLGSLLVYDVFMVFVTPYMTKDGCSIMVEVATGGGCDQGGSDDYPSPPHYREQLPIIFRVPRVTDPVLRCYDLGVDLQYPPMMLGLGDVILPGLLIGFCFAMDFIWKVDCHIFGVVSVCSYGFGMIVTFAALMLMKRAQPALIYLVPLTLVPVVVTAKIKNMLGILWRGETPSADEVHKVTEDSYIPAPKLLNYQSANERTSDNNIRDGVAATGSHPVVVNTI